jgi:hypothetical protein
MSDYVDCKHCGAQGTCANAPGNKSCAVCREHWREQWFKTYAKNANAQQMSALPDNDTDGLVCSVCRGLGSAEMPSTKWDYRFPAGLALIFIIASFGLIYYFNQTRDEQRFQQVLIFASTLIGSITGYYFGGARRSGRSLDAPKTSP